MAAQNARLVVGYCAKKAELKRMQEALAAERARWEVGSPLTTLLPKPCCGFARARALPFRAKVCFSANEAEDGKLQRKSVKGHAQGKDISHAALWAAIDGKNSWLICVLSCTGEAAAAGGRAVHGRVSIQVQQEDLLSGARQHGAQRLRHVSIGLPPEAQP